jgi:hypothetical protein
MISNQYEITLVKIESIDDSISLKQLPGIIQFGMI